MSGENISSSLPSVLPLSLFRCPSVHWLPNLPTLLLSPFVELATGADRLTDQLKRRRPVLLLAVYLPLVD